ncbi:3296_t:CDS:2, partial [Acaulospora morrowiae]
DMKHLQYLKLDFNPIQFPPKSIHCLPKGNEKEVMLPWLEGLKEYLRQHAAGKDSIEMEESDKSSGEEGVEKGHSPRAKPLKKSGSVESMSHGTTNLNLRVSPESSNHLNTISEDGHVVSKQETKRQNLKLNLDLPAARRDRSYSNDFDPMLNNHKVFVRQHSKSFSQDSVNLHGNQNGISEERSSDFYFQKLLTLPPTERLPMYNISLREASQNILYAFSQIHKSLRQFVTYTGNERIFTTELNKASILIGQLSATLQRFDTYALKAALDIDHWVKLLTVVQENISCFKNLMELLYKRLKLLTQYSDNIRYSRTLLLMLHGAVADIKFAWEHIHPLLTNDYTPYTGMAATPSRARAMSRSNSNSNINGTSYSSVTPTSSHSNGSCTPSTAGMSPFPTGPYNPYTDISSSTLIFEQLLALVENSIKAVENVIKYFSEQLDGEGPQRPSSPVKNKMKDLRAHVNTVSEVTKRLKKQILHSKFQAQKDLNIQLKIYKDTILFLQITIKMSTMAKDLSHDWQLDGKVMTGLGHVTKCNIDLTNFLRGIEGPGSASQPQYWPTIPGQPTSSPVVEPDNEEEFKDRGFDEQDHNDVNGKNEKMEEEEECNGEYESVTYEEPEEYEVVGDSIQGDEVVQNGIVSLS